MVSAEEQAEALGIVRELKSKVSDVIQHVEAQVKRVENGEWNTAKGVSFLEVKYQTLLSYLVNLTQLLCVKAKGQPIKGHPAIERLVELRTVLEKMRPIDKKLKYQLDKLLKTATTGTLGEKDPLRFKPNPDNLQNKFAEDSDEEGSDEDKPETSKIYRPPKLAAMAYDGDETAEDQQSKALRRAQKRALGSNIMRELRQEYYDGPEEIKDSGDMHRRKEDKAGKERQEYEEKYLTRMAISKKERNEARKLRTISGLNDLTHFGDISALTGEGNDDGPSRKKRKKSTPGKKKSKASKKWKRRK